ncbi:MAG: hypothetical protein CM1200mP2_39120 [Planctomycetaceae bacterium]|nr:MAG: hypothetical protein CM1200mP2_39120 [Planctomycetaceae bacterium]
MEPATNDCKAAALLSRRHILARAGAVSEWSGSRASFTPKACWARRHGRPPVWGNEDWPRWLLSKLTFPVGPVR